MVSRITLGTMTFGAPDWGCDEKTSHAILKKYIDMGGNHLDSADVYAGGKAEEIIGSFMPQVNRAEIIIASRSFSHGKNVEPSRSFQKTHPLFLRSEPQEIEDRLHRPLLPART